MSTGRWTRVLCSLFCRIRQTLTYAVVCCFFFQAGRRKYRARHSAAAASLHPSQRAGARSSAFSFCLSCERTLNYLMLRWRL